MIGFCSWGLEGSVFVLGFILGALEVWERRVEEEEHAGCLRKEKSSGMVGVERWRKKKKMKEEGKQSKGKKNCN